MTSPADLVSLGNGSSKTMRARVAVALELLGRAAAAPSSPMLDVFAVSVHLGVETSYVYGRAAELGACRLGSGPKARLRFSLEGVDRAVSCSAGRESTPTESGVVERRATRQRQRRLGTGVDLLPIRGRSSG